MTESMSPAEPPSRRAERVRRAIPPILVLAAAVGYLGADLWLDELPATVPGDVSPIVHAALVALQALSLIHI